MQAQEKSERWETTRLDRTDEKHRGFVSNQAQSLNHEILGGLITRRSLSLVLLLKQRLGSGIVRLNEFAGGEICPFAGRPDPRGSYKNDE